MKKILIPLTIIFIILAVVTFIKLNEYLQLRNYWGNNMVNAGLWLSPFNSNVRSITLNETYSGNVISYEYNNATGMIVIKLKPTDKGLGEVLDIEFPNKYLNETFITQDELGNYNIEPISNIERNLDLTNSSIVISLKKVFNGSNVEKYINNITFLNEN